MRDLVNPGLIRHPTLSFPSVREFKGYELKRSECLVRCDAGAPDIGVAREAMVEAYYALADAYVQVSARGTAADVPRASPCLGLSRFEEALRGAARTLAAHAGGDVAQDTWLRTVLSRVDDLRGVRTTGLTEVHARSLYQLKQSIDQVTGN
jgi:hypothetical protein